MGPRGATPSPERRRRVAVQEGATALIATLLPAIEPVRPHCVRRLGVWRNPVLSGNQSCRGDLVLSPVEPEAQEPWQAA